MVVTGGAGARVTEERKLAGLTQYQLATRASVSVSLIRAVEQGRAPASPAFVSAVARALGVGVAELLDQPFARANRGERQLHSVVPALRREMAAYLLPPGEEVPWRSLDELAREVEEAARLRHQADLAGLGATLPGLLEELRAATHILSGSERERAFWLLGEAYCAAWQVVYKLGYLDLASLTEDRYEWAAARCGDELAVLRGDYGRAGELITSGEFAGARGYLERSRATIEDRLGHADAPTLSMWGNLHLKSALAAARAGDRDGADDHLAEARETAERIGADRDDYRMCFGPTNVAIWSVGLAVEAQDGTEAVKRAERFTPPPGAPRERVGHYWIDLARGWLLHGDRERALTALIKARHTAPQQTRYHPMVHETVRLLARQDRRRSSPVAGFATWCGIS
jgi:transcriptional regulator with XRE-family HTH domain